MGILDFPNELLFLVAKDFSIRDLTMFRSTSSRLLSILTPHFQQLCLQDIGELTALQWAAVRGHVELIDLAISNGAEIDAPVRGQLEEAALSMVDRPDYSFTCKLANDSAETDAKDSIIRTPLFLAACCGRTKAIAFLLKLGASMQCFGGMMTPAHISARRGDIDCMEAFITPSFDFNARGCDYSTILHEAIISGAEMVMYLLQLEGGKKLVNARASDGSTPLHRVLPSSGFDNTTTSLMVELLVQTGADIYLGNDRGDTPAHHFVRWGNVECLQALIAAGLDFNVRGRYGQTILHAAVHAGKEIAEYLLGQEEGRRLIGVGDFYGSTPLHYALKLPSKEIVKLLKRHGANVLLCEVPYEGNDEFLLPHTAWSLE